MHRRILRDGRILNCQTGVDPTRAVNGDCGGDRLGQGRTKSPLALHCLLTMSCSYYKRRPRGHLQAIFELLDLEQTEEKIGQNRFHDPAPQTRGFLTSNYYAAKRPIVNPAGFGCTRIDRERRYPRCWKEGLPEPSLEDPRDEVVRRGYYGVTRVPVAVKLGSIGKCE